MIVHFISGKNNIEENMPYLRKIVTTIHKSGHVLSRDWIEQAHIAATQGLDRPPDWQLVFQENMDSLNKADVLIAEITERSFGVGYQVALASQQKKPILLLRRKGTSNGSLADGISYDYIQRKDYTQDDVAKFIETFLDEHDIKAKDMRFNFFIDRNIYNYLRWASFKMGKTKAEILRELVLKEIDRSGR